GPARTAQWMVTLDYCRELGVPIETFVNRNAQAYIHTNGQTFRQRTARADMYGYVAELLATATDSGALDRKPTAEDRDRLLTFLRRFGDLGPKLDYEGSTRRGFFDYPGLAEADPFPPPGSLSEVLAAGTGRAITNECGQDQASTRLQGVAGSEAVASRRVEATGERRSATRAEGSKITDVPDGLEVTGDGGRI